MNNTSTTWMSGFENGDFQTGVAACDGIYVAGETGLLNIALTIEGLRRLAPRPNPVAWLLPLDSVTMVRQSASLPGELLWLCPRPPQSLVGLLLGDFRGAWIEKGRAYLKLRDGLEAYDLPSRASEEGSLTTLAGLVARRWQGAPPSQVRHELRIAGSAPFTEVTGRLPQQPAVA